MNTIYIRTLKRAEHTVFSVSDGQKTYYDNQFGQTLPFSSGQQIKYSLLSDVCSALNTAPAPTTFISKVKKSSKTKNLEFEGEGEVFGPCNPQYPDQLFGGWMKAVKGSGEKTLKRRSPLSISAMRPLHPLLAGTPKENLSFDRRERSNNEVIIKDENGNLLSKEQIDDFLSNRDKQTSLTSKYLQNHKRATGLFVQDIAIDLRRLFSVSLNSFEPEMSEATIEKLKAEGWVESENVFGPCLVAPQSLREKWIAGLAHAIINWRITSNQSRTFSLMDTLAIAISDNANLVAGSIRAKLSEEDSRKADPIVDENLKGVETFITLQAGGYILTKGETADALEKAEQKLIDLMSHYDYEHQVPQTNR
ncbi:MAG: CRISPR-associated protein Cas7 [Bacteroidota bacterium]|nr:CRISPR-associated protein Cas7 [Bacteroidota bacterium]